jgi:hydrogenase/urease accessory protein HupE
MKKALFIFLALLLSSASTFAHRLNEYLEATTISLSAGEVLVELRLTPGVDVAAAILKRLDLNGDDRISKAEEQAYLSMMARDVSFFLDGDQTTPALLSSSFPTVAEMKKGFGEISIKYALKIKQERSSHQLKLHNLHFSQVGVYLVNCLLPTDSSIVVVNQTRSVDQSQYQLDFSTGNTVLATTADQTQSLENTNDWATVRTYFVHGIRHILTGYDHLLFLCALVLGAAGIWDLFKIVTAFTIAHSITLTLATYGLAHLPTQIVEPMIAASIVFVAVQNIFWPKLANGNSRLAVAFFFGLFHGLGFAGGLLNLMHAMPSGLIVFAILGFSLGVEAGNQLVLLPLYGFLKSLRRIKAIGNSQGLLPVRRYMSAGVALAGINYFVHQFS